MRTVISASLKHHKRRYVASALAVVMGVAFIVAVNGLAGALRSGMTAGVGERFSGSDHVVIVDSDAAIQVERTIAQAGGTSSPVWSGTSPVRDAATGIALGDFSFGTSTGGTRFKWLQVVEGNDPLSSGEAVLSEQASAKFGLSVGDGLAVSGAVDEVKLTVVGIVEQPAYGAADIFVRGDDAALISGVALDYVLASGPMPDVETSTDAYVEVTPTPSYVAELQAQITDGIDIIAMLVSFFAAIALGVAILVIANTFAILFAQRSKDFALLRCIGVTPRQLRHSVRIEALVLGIVAAVVGAILGAGIAWAGAIGIGAFTDALGGAAFSTPWIVGAIAMGTAVTVIAAWLPTRAVTRVSPLAAMRPVDDAESETQIGTLRSAMGVVAVAVGSAGLGLLVWAGRGDGNENPSLLMFAMFAAGGLFFAGLMALGPVLVPGLIAGFGRLRALSPVPARASQPIAQLAAANAGRNPGRTAATAASLMVGVTLTTAVMAGMGSIKTSMEEEMGRSYPLDVVALPQSGTVSKVLATAVAEAPSVADVAVVSGVTASAADRVVAILGVTGSETVLRERVEPVEPGWVVVPWEMVNPLGAALTDPQGRALADSPTGTAGDLLLRLSSPDGAVEVPVELSGRFGTTALTTDTGFVTELASELGVRREAVALWIRAVDDVAGSQLSTEIVQAAATSADNVDLAGDYGQRDFISRQLTIITVAVVGLLSVAVVIALIGIANTLGLSVLERSRENALLRAMGLTRRQLRTILAWEGALIAVAATVMGIATGLLFAFVATEVLVGSLALEAAFTVPWLGLVVVLMLAVVGGVMASVGPSRRAARVAPAQGLVAL